MTTNFNLSAYSGIVNSQPGSHTKTWVAEDNPRISEKAGNWKQEKWPTLENFLVLSISSNQVISFYDYKPIFVKGLEFRKTANNQKKIGCNFSIQVQLRD